MANNDESNPTPILSQLYGSITERLDFQRRIKKLARQNSLEALNKCNRLLFIEREREAIRSIKEERLMSRLKKQSNKGKHFKDYEILRVLRPGIQLDTHRHSSNVFKLFKSYFQSSVSPQASTLKQIDEYVDRFSNSTAVAFKGSSAAAFGKAECYVQLLTLLLKDVRNTHDEILKSVGQQLQQVLVAQQNSVGIPPSSQGVPHTVCLNKPSFYSRKSHKRYLPSLAQNKRSVNSSSEVARQTQEIFSAEKSLKNRMLELQNTILNKTNRFIAKHYNNLSQGIQLNLAQQILNSSAMPINIAGKQLTQRMTLNEESGLSDSNFIKSIQSNRLQARHRYTQRAAQSGDKSTQDTEHTQPNSSVSEKKQFLVKNLKVVTLPKCARIEDSLTEDTQEPNATHRPTPKTIKLAEKLAESLADSEGRRSLKTNLNNTHRIDYTLSLPATIFCSVNTSLSQVRWTQLPVTQNNVFSKKSIRYVKTSRYTSFSNRFLECFSQNLKSFYKLSGIEDLEDSALGCRPRRNRSIGSVMKPADCLQWVEQNVTEVILGFINQNIEILNSISRYTESYPSNRSKIHSGQPPIKREYQLMLSKIPLQRRPNSSSKTKN